MSEKLSEEQSEERYAGINPAIEKEKEDIRTEVLSALKELLYRRKIKVDTSDGDEIDKIYADWIAPALANISSASGNGLLLPDTARQFNMLQESLINPVNKNTEYRIKNVDKDIQDIVALSSQVIKELEVKNS